MRAVLPLFPLDHAALYPDVALPLHVFEPRYRALVRDALAGERLIGMATVQPGHTREMAGAPPLCAVGCAGRIARHERLPDGRFHLLLRATQRFRICEELPGEEGYRRARVAWLDEETGDEAQVLAARERVTALLDAVAERAQARRARSEPAEAHAAARGEGVGTLRTLEHGAFTHRVAQALALPADEKQALLEAPSLAARLALLASALDFHLARQTRGAVSQSRALH